MSSFIAALPMYDWPEVRAEVDAEWAAIRERLRARGVDAPESLTREAAASGALDLGALWRHPRLLLTQTCWGPMGLGLAEHVRVVGQPDYSAYEGGQGEFYSSAVVMRRDDDGGDAGAGAPPPLTPPHKGEGDLASGSFPSPLWGGVRGGGGTASASAIPLECLRGLRFAYNSADSMSGILALGSDLEAAGESLAIFCDHIETGGHRASIRAVGEGGADVAAIDCRSWAMAQRFEPAAKALAVVGWTSQRKGLPFVTARGTPPEAVAALEEVLA